MSNHFAVLLAASIVISASAITAPAAPAITIVAAENFYGSIAAQLGGERAAVTSILSDPNIDPHQYESSVADAKAVATADCVIENGGGYDDWMDKLLSVSSRGPRVLIKGFDIAPNKLPDNEHVWYDVDNVQAIARALTDSLKKLDPAGAGAYTANFQAFASSLAQIRQKIARIRDRWKGAPIGLTETVFLYQSNALGLVVTTPVEFQKAIAQGNDPPADTVVEAVSQVKGRKIKVLVANEQTISPVTTRLQDTARAAGIPVVLVTETMPSGSKYQDWMLGQLAALERALGK